MSNFVSISDVVIFDPEISVHGWNVRKSALGITWYHHKGSKIKTFEKPKPPIPVTQPQVFRADPNLSDGWEEIRDPDGRLFYYHRATKVSKWTRPQGNQLPVGWMECTNPDGRTYYKNAITQAITWDRPVGSSLVNDDQKSIRSVKSEHPETTEWSPMDKRQSISSIGQSTATPQSPTTIRSSTILETPEWLPCDIEKTTVPAHRVASAPYTFVETTNWSPSDPQHRPIPTRAETQPLPVHEQYDQYGNRKKSVAAHLVLPPGSAAATKAVVHSTKTVASATAKGVKVAANKLKHSKNAQKIVAGVGMAAVNAVLMNQFGVKIPASVGTAAVGLINVIPDEALTVTDVADTDGTVGNDTGNNMDVIGNGDQAYIPDSSADAMNVNQINTMAGDDYVVGGDAVVEEVVFIPEGPTPMVQQPQQMMPNSTQGGPQHVNTGVPRNAAPGPINEFSSGMQRPVTMIGSPIPVHVPQQVNQRMAPAGAGVQTQRSVAPHVGPGQHPGPAGHVNTAQSHIPVHSHPPNNPQNATPHQNQPQQQTLNLAHNPGHSQVSHQPQWANQPQIAPQHQGQNQQQGPQPQRPNQQQNASRPQRPNQTQFNQHLNQSQPQRPQLQNPGRPQGAQSQNSGRRPGQPVVNPHPHKPLLNSKQKHVLMNVGMKFATSLIKSEIKSEMRGNSGGGIFGNDDNDNSFDFGDTSNDFSNDGGDAFDSNDNFDNVTADYDPQDQGQDQYADADQQSDNGFGGGGSDTGSNNDMNDYGGNNQFDNGFGGGGSDTGSNNNMNDYGGNNQFDNGFGGGGSDVGSNNGMNDYGGNNQFDNSFGEGGSDAGSNNGMNDYGGNDQFVGCDNPPDNASDGNIYDDNTMDQQATDTTGYDPTLSAEAGFNVAPDATYDQQSDINLQSQGILQASMGDDNAAMNDFSSAPDTFNTQIDGGYDPNSAPQDNAIFPQDIISDPNAGSGTNTAAGNNFWTMDLPQPSSTQTTAASQAYAGLTSASLSGPMTDYYDGFDPLGGDVPLGQDQSPTTPIDISSGLQGDGFFQDPTLTSAVQNADESAIQDSNAFISILDAEVSMDQSMDQSSDQASATAEDPTMEDTDNLVDPTNNNSNTGSPVIQPQTSNAAISQLYDGSAYDDPDSAGNSPVDVQPMTPTVTGSLTPDAMPDPASLIIGQ